MIEDKKNKEKKRTNKPLNSADLEKTDVNLNIRDFEDSDEETVIVRLSEEDSDFHDIVFDEENERTGEHLFKEEIKEKVIVDQKKTPPQKPLSEKKKSEPEIVNVVSEISQFVPIPKVNFKYVILSFLFIILLSDAFIECLRHSEGLRLPVALALAFSLLMFGGVLLKRWEGRSGFVWILVAWFGLIAFAGSRFYTSSVESLRFFNFSLEVLMGPILFLVPMLVFLMWVRDTRIPSISKLFCFLALLLNGIALGTAFFMGQTLENSLWDPPFLSPFPLWVRPIVLSLYLTFPLLTFAVLIALLLRRHLRRGVFRTTGIPLLMIGLLGMLLSFRLLNRQGAFLPLVKQVFPPAYFGVTWLDPFSERIRIQIASEGAKSGDEQFPLTLAASLSRVEGKGRKSRLLVRNPEGRDFVANLNKSMSLSRAGQKISQGEIYLETAELTKMHDVLVLLDLPGVVETQVKTSLSSGLFQLASILNAKERLILYAAQGSAILTRENRQEWQKLIAKTLVYKPSEPQALWTGAMQQLKGGGGSKQVIWVTESNHSLSPEQRQLFAAEFQKQKGIASFLVLGGNIQSHSGSYLIPTPASLGFGLLSAVAETFGEYTISFPDLPDIPRLSVARDSVGNVLVREGRFVDLILPPGEGNQPASLKIKVDQEPALDLEVSQAAPAIDLTRYQLKPGEHRFEIILTTAAGEVIRTDFETPLIPKSEIKFIKPLENDSIAGNFNVLLSEGKSASASTVSVDLLVDGVKIGSATSEPYLIPLDTTTLAEGEHVLQAVQTFSDNAVEIAQIQVMVQQQAPQIKILNPSNGEYLDSLALIEADISAGLFTDLPHVEFLVNGEVINESTRAPYKYLWPNEDYPPGKYFIQARAHLNDQISTTDAVQVQLGQAEVTVHADPALGRSGMFYPNHVEVMIDASQSMAYPIGSAQKLDLAKAAVSELLKTLPGDTKINLRIMGGESGNLHSDCESVPHLKKIGTELESLKASGKAPLAKALEFLGKDLEKSQGSRIGILITDGWDSCDGDPFGVAERLVQQEPRTQLAIIYFADVNSATESLLKRLAETIGGNAYRVENNEDIKMAVYDAVQMSFALKDIKNNILMEKPIGEIPLQVRSGDYRLEVNTVPPLIKEKLSLPPGVKKVFNLKKQDGHFVLNEE